MQVGDPAAMKSLGVVEKPGHVIGSFNPSYHRAHFSEGRMKVPATFRRIDGKNEAFKLPLIQSRPLKYSEPSVWDTLVRLFTRIFGWRSERRHDRRSQVA
jgi:hypothetical protein